MRHYLLRIGAIMALTGLMGCLTAFPAVEGKFERTLTIAGPVTLEVTTGSGSIDVKAGNPGLVRIRGVIVARDDRHATAEEKVKYLESRPPIEQSGNVIRIGRIEEDDYRNNVSIRYEIETPPETALTSRAGSGGQRISGLQGRLELATGSGAINLDNIRGDVSAQAGSGGIEAHTVTGRLELRTGSGSIKALAIAGSVSASTGSGGITLNLSAAEQGSAMDVEAHTGSGSIDISGISGSLRASTGSGSIKAGGNPMGNWSLHTSSGSVALDVPPDAAFDLNARTASGRINFEKALDFDGALSRKEARGKFRGGGNLVEVRTGSGSIELR